MDPYSLNRASLCAVVLMGFMITGGHSEALTDLYEKAKYHLQEFQNAYKEIESVHAIHKRSTIETRDDVSQSIEALCAAYETKKLKDTSQWEEEKIAKEKFIEGKEVGGEKFNGIVPVKVRARRNGSKVNLTFEVFLTSEAFVSSFYSLDYKKYVIDYPDGETGPVSATVQVEADASRCDLDPPDTSNEIYLFSLAADSHGYVSQTEVDLCTFDHQRTEDDGETWRKSDKTEFIQVLPLPRFQFIGFPDDGVIIERNKKAEVEVEATFDEQSTLEIYLTAWDWTQKKFVKDFLAANYKPSWDDKGVKVQRVDIDGDKEHFIHATVMNQAPYNRTVRDEEDDKGNTKQVSKAKIGIQVEFGEREISGILNIAYRKRLAPQQTGGRPVRRVAVDRMVFLRLPYKLSPIPRNTVDLTAHDEECNKDGRVTGQKYGKNCIVECFAFGTDIESIFLVKSHPYRAPVQSTSYVLLGINAMVMQNVGPASTENGGKYQCSVITRDGKIHTADINLRTQGFTKVTNFTLEDLGNGSALVECSASGDPPLNISISSERYEMYDVITERLDENLVNVPVRTSDEGTAGLALTLDASIMNSSYSLVCEVTGPGGFDTMHFT